jgi:hypothetical protein
MKRAIFNYPTHFTTLPEYTKHAGQEVEVLDQLVPPEVDGNPDDEPMFNIRAADGWTGKAFASELKDIPQ